MNGIGFRVKGQHDVFGVAHLLHKCAQLFLSGNHAVHAVARSAGINHIRPRPHPRLRL